VALDLSELQIATAKRRRVRHKLEKNVARCWANKQVDKTLNILQEYVLKRPICTWKILYLTIHLSPRSPHWCGRDPIRCPMGPPTVSIRRTMHTCIAYVCTYIHTIYTIHTIHLYAYIQTCTYTHTHTYLSYVLYIPPLLFLYYTVFIYILLLSSFTSIFTNIHVYLYSTLYPIQYFV
jgi:hypothetical protein